MFQVLEDEDKWNACIAETGMDTIFCSRNLSRLYFSNPRLFLCRKEQKTALFVFSQEGDIVKGLHYGGIITNSQDEVFHSEVSSSFLQYLDDHGVVSCQIRNHPFLETIKVGVLIKEEPVVFVDLTKSLDELVGAITKQHFRCVRRAQENGLEVEYSEDIRYLKPFYEFYKMSHERKGLQPKGFNFFEEMFGLLRRHLIVAVVRKVNTILAVSLLLRDSGSIFMTYGGMSDEGYECNAKHFMIFEMILSFKLKNFSRLVLGTGSSGKDSIYNFKKGFTEKEFLVGTHEIR